jgi:hypothetical protein
MQEDETHCTGWKCLVTLYIAGSRWARVPDPLHHCTGTKDTSTCTQPWRRYMSSHSNGTERYEYEYEYRVRPMTHRAMYIIYVQYRLSCRNTQWTGVDRLYDPLQLLSILPAGPGSRRNRRQTLSCSYRHRYHPQPLYLPQLLPKLSSSTSEPPILSFSALRRHPPTSCFRSHLLQLLAHASSPSPPRFILLLSSILLICSRAASASYVSPCSSPPSPASSPPPMSSSSSSESNVNVGESKSAVSGEYDGLRLSASRMGVLYEAPGNQCQYDRDATATCDTAP